MKIIDLSLAVDSGCMTCGAPWHEKVRIERMGTAADAGRNTSRLVLGSHSATHMDAPLHFFDGMHGVDRNSLETCAGPVSCIDFTGKGAGSVVCIGDVEGLDVSERMLFAFGWHKHWKTDRYYDSYPYFSEEAVRHLVDAGMKLMALDTPSPDAGDDVCKKGGSPNHRLLLSHDIVIVEYLAGTDRLDFSKSYEIIALPLKIKDADGAPARVIAREA